MERSKEIRLLSEWMGNQKGKVMRLPSLIAKQLINRGQAELSEITDKVMPKLQRKSNDKMVKSSVNK